MYLRKAILMTEILEMNNFNGLAKENRRLLKVFFCNVHLLLPESFFV